MRGAGRAAFAAVLLLIAGTLNIIYGIAAISDSKFFVNDTTYVFSNLNTWGWIVLVLGVIEILAAMSLMGGGVFGRAFGIFAASLGALGALMAVSGAHPFWSLGVFAICLIVIHGLFVYDPDAV